MVNQFYLDNFEQIKKTLKEESIVTLFDFLKKKEFLILQKKIRKLKFQKDQNLMTHSYSKSTIKIKKNDVVSFINKILDKKIKVLQTDVLSFKWKDYTILHDKTKQTPGYDFILDLTISWNKEFGGQINYVDGSGDYAQITPRKNTLTIVKRQKGVRRFVKYVNNKVGRKEMILLFLQI